LPDVANNLIGDEKNSRVLARVRDWTLLVFCNLIWASSFVWIKFAQRQVGPICTTLFPTTLATILLVGIVRAGQKRADSRGKKPPVPLRDVLDFVLIGIAGQVVTQFFGTWGTQLSLASNGALLMLTLPISTALMAHFLLGERMTRLRWISFILAIAGVVECSGIDWKELNFTSPRYMLGNVLLFVSVLGSAFYNVFSKKLLRRYSPLEVQLYSCYVVVIFLLPFALTVEPRAFRTVPEFTTGVWFGLLMLALFHYFLSMIIFLRVLSRLDATQAGLSNYLIPFFGVLLAALILHERLTRFMVLGGLIVLGSTLLVTVLEEQFRVRAVASAGGAE
jgi:drug/metabolite transporter (DMT)-like permease